MAEKYITASGHNISKEYIKLGEFWIDKELVRKFNCGCYALTLDPNSSDRYCPSCLSNALDQLIMDIDNLGAKARVANHGRGR